MKSKYTESQLETIFWMAVSVLVKNKKLDINKIIDNQKKEMSELTINQIKERQRQLEADIKKLLNDFHDETKIVVKGEIHFGYTSGKNQNWINLKYDNPF